MPVIPFIWTGRGACLALMALALLLSRGARADEPPARPDTVRLSEVTTRRDPVPFRHRAHEGYAGAETCATCHHRESPADGRYSRCTACHVGRPKAMAAFHGLCKGCHARADAAGARKGPTNCEDGGCHGALVMHVAGARQPPVRFDHRGHRLALQGNCQRCHHVDPPDTVPRACTTCHKGPDAAKDAFHNLCIKCHIERAGGRPGEKGSRCGDCHVAAVPVASRSW